jgi:hypothetical protein
MEVKKWLESLKFTHYNKTAVGMSQNRRKDTNLLFWIIYAVCM